MCRRFLSSLVWGGVMAAIVGTIVKPFVRPRKKPLVERSADAIRDTTDELVHKAKRVRRRIMKSR